MGIKSVISAGTKSNQFEGPIVKIGASNSIKLTRQVLDATGAEYGHFAFIADDTDDNSVFYLATCSESTNDAGERGSKLGIVGEVTDAAKANPNQLAFTHATLGSRLYNVAATFTVDTEKGFEHNGLTFYPMTVLQSREEADAEKAANESAKASKASNTTSRVTADVE
jgi:hypothetical protein